MTRWIALPLTATAILGASAFLDALERTTVASLRLARTSEGAPATTRAAVDEVGPLPAIAELTTRQADAFGALAAALELSATRVVDLNASLGEQVDDLRDLARSIEQLDAEVGCVRARLAGLNEASRDAPRTLGEIATILRRVDASQRKSLRHLRSINRKMTALGIVAGVIGVEPPRAPSGAPAPQPGPAPAGVRCRHAPGGR